MYDEQEVVKRIQESKSPIALSQLVRIFRVAHTERREFRRMLRDLERRGRIATVRGKSYTAPSGKSSAIIGRLEINTKGFGFVRPDWSNLSGKPPFKGDLFIAESNMADALDGDTVRAEFLREDDRGASGRVEEVLERAHTRIVGQYRQVTRYEGEVKPRSSRIPRRIVVPIPPAALGVKDFDYVEVEITDFPPAPHPLNGEVKARLGEDSDKGIDVLLVLRDLGIYEEFPVTVEEEVKNLAFNWEQDLKNRADYRGLPTITIDPKTAKDYDDALSLERLSGGVVRLYVHIADVAHFVKRGTALDDEARERSTSVYPVDRVVPMLPQKLSNYLCSLVANEDRLTVTAVMDIDTTGKIIRSEFHSSVINSNHRLAYEQVQAAYNEIPGAAEPFQDVVPLLLELRGIARILRKARFARGALDLDIPEVKIVFDAAGAVEDIRFYERFEAHQVVEECMLIANEAVAEYLTKREAPLLYRIHEMADQERLEKIVPVLAAFGIRLQQGADGRIRPKDIQKALEQAQKLEAGHVLRRIVLRALKRAEYDPENAGHFGLASECYCHFTSPIRRYPDVVVHRQLKALEKKGPLEYPVDDNDLDELGTHCSQRERRAQEAEWESTEIKAIEFMRRHLGEEFEAYIISVHAFGMFVELVRYPIEGFIKIASIKGDHFRLDDMGIMLKGESSGRIYKIGGKVRVRVDRVNPMARQMDLTLLDQDEKPLFGRRAKGLKFRRGK